MSEGLGLALSLLLLGATLIAAAWGGRRRLEPLVAGMGALALLATGVIGVTRAGDALNNLAPTVGFLACLLVIADGARREGVFVALGSLMDRSARGSPLRLLRGVIAAATGVTVLLGLDATVILLTPVVLLTASRLRADRRPHAYATGHLANSASLLLPISNLTNLLAFHASRLSFARFAALMALPTLAAVAVEWVVLRRWFAAELDQPARRDGDPRVPMPRAALALLTATLVGFMLSTLVGVAAVWVALAGALAFTVLAASRGNPRPLASVRAAEPGFLLFVLALGVIVAAADHDGLDSVVRAVLPTGASLADLLGVAAVAAVLANLLNNLPATLVLIGPVAASHGALLAVLIGVNVGPNLTYAGSLATLLWRRVLHASGMEVSLREFTALGLATVPAALVAATVLLWVALRV
ncbi:MAG TPA: ArsB/NhaD family transporter [Solirubrobacteraceae bacterium]|nr:ArsB/NhaD family transporter [Solirubrobacteraceae bacterium]